MPEDAKIDKPPRGPRGLCVEPEKFGRRDATWKDPGKDQKLRDDLMVAYYIHQVVLVLRRTLTDKGMTQREFATRVDMKEESLGRKMRGELWASLRDILKWADNLGIDLLPELGAKEELRPPEEELRQPNKSSEPDEEEQPPVEE